MANSTFTKFLFSKRGLLIFVSILIIKDVTAGVNRASSEDSDSDSQPLTQAEIEKQKKLNAVIKDITTPRTTLMDDSINAFIDMANAYQKEYEMADVLLSQWPELYEPHKNQTNSVQILYGGKVGEGHVGHYICIFYKYADGTVYVYDSLRPPMLTSLQKEIVARLYPNAVNIKYTSPKTFQNDGTSCGIFAIAYATTIILGGDPEKVQFKLNNRPRADQSTYMREHVKNMILSKKLMPFPTAEIPPPTRKPSIKSNEAKKNEERKQLDRKLKEILVEITTPGEPLTDNSINAFINIVNGVQKRYNLIDVLLSQVPSLYQPHENRTNDVQILFDDEAEVGHFICIYYSYFTKIVYIYDSLLQRSVSDKQMDIIGRRYPDATQIQFTEPMSVQRDDTSSGIFAIAYATTLILGGDPEEIEFKLSRHPQFGQTAYMREHIVQMFLSKRLAPFPEAEYFMI